MIPFQSIRSQVPGKRSLSFSLCGRGVQPVFLIWVSDFFPLTKFFSGLIRKRTRPNGSITQLSVFRAFELRKNVESSRRSACGHMTTGPVLFMSKTSENGLETSHESLLRVAGLILCDKVKAGSLASNKAVRSNFRSTGVRPAA